MSKKKYSHFEKNMDKYVIHFQDLSTFGIIRYVFLFLFSLQSIIACPIGLLTLHNCISNVYLPIWLSIHGFLCILYYIVSIVTFAYTPMKSSDLKKEYIELKEIQNQILKDIDDGMKTNGMEQNTSIENYLKFRNLTETRKFTRDEIMSVVFAVILSISIFIGCFFISITPKELCNVIPYFYCLALVISSVLFVFIVSICVIITGKIK